MNLVRKITLLGLLLVGVPASVYSQECTFDYTQHYEPLTRLFNDFDPSGDGDSFTVPVWLSSSGNSLRETWYIPADSLPNTGPLYRFFNAGLQDHMDRPDPNTVPASYVLEPAQPLGYPWVDFSRDGLTVMKTWFGDPFDHRTWLSDEVPSESGITYSSDATFNPIPGPGRLGYQRLGTSLIWPQNETEETYVIGNGLLSVEFNRNWGNVLQKINHLPSGKQLIDPGIGDLVSSLIRFPADNCRLPNPTQAGGVLCPQNGSTQLWAGSPVLEESLSVDTLESIIRPLEFCHGGQNVNGTPWPSADTEEILAWNGIFERYDRLGCNISGVIRDDVVASRFRAMLSDFHVLSSQSVAMTTGYFVSVEFVGDARFNDFSLEWVNLETGQTTSLAYQDSQGDVLWGEGSGTNNFVFPDVGDDHAVMAYPGVGVGFAIASIQSAAVTDERVQFYLRCEDENLEPDCPNDRQEFVIDVKRSDSTVTRETLSDPINSFTVIGTRSEMLARLAELNSVDGDCEPTIFADGFESGDALEWDAVCPTTCVE